MTHEIITTTPNLGSEKIISFPAGGRMANSATAQDAIYETQEAMPREFSLEADGIYQLRPGDDDNLVPIRVCSPLIVKGVCRNLNGTGWGRVVMVEDPDRVWHQLILDQRDVSKKSMAALNTLFDHGLALASVDKAAQSVLELLSSWQPNGRYTRVHRLGWADKKFGSFVLGCGKVIGCDHVIVDTISEDVAGSMHEHGTLDSWVDQVAKPCEGNALMILALCHAFTGPLLSMLDRDGGGFHLRGVSSRGKSTLLGVAASVWGAPSFVQSWRGTDNGIEGIAAACNDSLLVLDELHQMDPRDAGATVYMLANGRGKQRMKSNGTAHNINRWTVPVLSSGEISLEEHMASGGRSMHAGQDIRLIDIGADTRPHGAFDILHGEIDGRAFAERLQRAVQANYGHAGPAFVRELMQVINKREMLLRYIDKFCRSCEEQADLPADGQVQRVLAKFGIAALAGELATKFGLTSWKPGAAQSASRELFIAWFETRDGSTQTEIKEAVDRTQRYVAKNLAGFAKLGAQTSRPRHGWCDEEWIYIFPECWKTIHEAKDPVKVARLLHGAGLLKPQKGEGLQFRMGREVPDRPRVYAVKATAIEALANS